MHQATDRNPDYEGDYYETTFGGRVTENNSQYAYI